MTSWFGETRYFCCAVENALNKRAQRKEMKNRMDPLPSETVVTLAQPKGCGYQLYGRVRPWRYSEYNIRAKNWQPNQDPDLKRVGMMRKDGTATLQQPDRSSIGFRSKSFPCDLEHILVEGLRGLSYS